MSDVTYQNLKDHLEGIDPSNPGVSAAPVYLIFGNEMLVGKAFNQVLDCLMPEEQRNFGYEPLDGTVATAADVVERVTTYGLTPELKLVAWRDARLFRPASDKKQLIDASRNAFGAQENRKAANYFLRFLSAAKLNFEDIGQAERAAGQIQGLSGGREEDWVDDLISYCQERNLRPTAAEGQAELVKRVLEKGLPKRHTLIITTESVDRRQGLYKIISEQGIVIDCSVPKGNRRADRQAQEKVLADTMQAVLKPYHKTMDRNAFKTLCEQTGFDLRTFTNNLEILVQYVGSRSEINAADVKGVLQRTKQDPIYELTNAVSDRDLDRSLFYLATLLDAHAHPLQVLAALTNQFRRLLLAADFIESDFGRVWFEECSYNQFKSQVIPAMLDYDKLLLEELDKWEQDLNSDSYPATGKSSRSKNSSSKKTADLLVARNPNNAYPLYLLMRKLGRFTIEDLLKAMEELLDSDRHLKSSPQEPKLVLEKLIVRLCGARPQSM